MRRFLAVVLVALTLGGGLAGAAQAQSFGLFFGDQRSDFAGDGGETSFPERISCLNDYQIRAAVAALGYRDIYLNVANNKHIEVRATKGRWVYLLDFNYCSAHIESQKRLRPAR